MVHSRLILTLNRTKLCSVIQAAFLTRRHSTEKNGVSGFDTESTKIESDEIGIKLRTLKKHDGTGKANVVFSFILRFISCLRTIWNKH